MFLCGLHKSKDGNFMNHLKFICKSRKTSLNNLKDKIRWIFLETIIVVQNNI